MIESLKYEGLYILRQTEYYVLTPTSYFAIFPDKTTMSIEIPKWHAIDGIVENEEALKYAEQMWELHLNVLEKEKEDGN